MFLFLYLTYYNYYITVIFRSCLSSELLLPFYRLYRFPFAYLYSFLIPPTAPLGLYRLSFWLLLPLLLLLLLLSLYFNLDNLVNSVVVVSAPGFALVEDGEPAVGHRCFWLSSTGTADGPQLANTSCTPGLLSGSMSRSRCFLLFCAPPRVTNRRHGRRQQYNSTPTTWNNSDDNSQRCIGTQKKQMRHLTSMLYLKFMPKKTVGK